MIKYVDELRFEMRNTNKYTKLYSGETPIFVEDNIFEIVIPMGNVANLQVGPEETNKETGKEKSKSTSKEYRKKELRTNKNTPKTGKEKSKSTSKEICNRIIDILEIRPEITVREVAKVMEISVSGARYHIDKMKKNEMIEHIGSTKKGKWIVHK